MFPNVFYRVPHKSRNAQKSFAWRMKMIFFYARNIIRELEVFIEKWRQRFSRLKKRGKDFFWLIINFAKPRPTYPVIPLRERPQISTNLWELLWRKLEKLEIFYGKEITVISFIRLVRVSMGFYISENLVFVNFQHTNSYKLVVFCGWSLTNDFQPPCGRRDNNRKHFIKVFCIFSL